MIHTKIDFEDLKEGINDGDVFLCKVAYDYKDI